MRWRKLNKPVTGESATFHYPYSLDGGVIGGKKGGPDALSGIQSEIALAAVMGIKKLVGLAQQF